MPEDAIKIAPDAYKVVLENDRVRVLEYRGGPGAKTEMHSHPAVVACPLSGGKFKFTSPDGQTMEVEMNVGDAMYLDAVDHATENIGTGEARVIIVELK